MTALCTRCNAPLESDAVVLWDDHAYCRPCVNTAEPTLAEYAAAHAAFDDSFPMKRAILPVILLRIVCVLIFASVALISALQNAKTNPLYVILLLSAITAFCAAAPLRRRLLHAISRRMPGSYAPHVHIARGRVTVTWKPEVTRQTFSCALRDCTWSRVNAVNDLFAASGKFAGFDQGLVRIIALNPDWVGLVIWVNTPARRRGLIRGTGVPFGSSPEMVRMCQAFLELAGVPEVAVNPVNDSRD